MNWNILTFALGAIMFLHYGCSILKHDSAKSVTFLKMALLVAITMSVQIMVASLLADVFWTMTAVAIFSATQICVSIYLWTFGMSYKKAAAKVQSYGGFNLHGLVHRIKRAL